jgi:hypothetical protein
VAPAVVGLLLGVVSLAAVLIGLAVLLVVTAAGLLTARTGTPARPP